MSERIYNNPIRVKVRDVALFGIKEQIDTLEKGELVLRNVEQITTIKLTSYDYNEYLGVLLSRLNQETPRFLIVIPYPSLFNDYLENRMYSEDVDYPFLFNYDRSILPFLSTKKIISCSNYERNPDMLPTIQQLLLSPILTPSLPLLRSDSPDYTSPIGHTASDTHSTIRHSSSIKLCFHP